MLESLGPCASPAWSSARQTQKKHTPTQQANWIRRMWITRGILGVDDYRAEQ